MSKTNVFITGNSSGLGLGFTEHYLSKGYDVYGTSRRGCNLDHSNLHDIKGDMNDLDSIATTLSSLFNKETHFDIVILNAGMLGNISTMQDTSIDHLNEVIQLNVWSNKIILDYFIEHNIECKQLILISSGAAVRGNKGWSAYALSKATLNMLTQLYAHEMPNTHLCALAPGLVDTAMQDHLCDSDKVNIEHFPSMQALRDARGTTNMPTPIEAARKIAAALPTLLNHDSGCFLDIRKL